MTPPRRVSCALALALLSACSTSISDDGEGAPSNTSGGAGGAAAGFGGTAGSGGGTSGTGGAAAFGGFGIGGAAAASGTGGASCASESAEARLQPVYLAFAFDVSGSMGQGDFEWHDRALKWEPVVAATKAFFADASAVGISASLVFFPAETDICLSATYAEPDVPMTALPSPAFAAEIDRITPVTADDWRGGTPTTPVIEATIAYLQPLTQTDPSAVHAIVLVTDGYPQSCEAEGNSIANVEAAVGAVATTIPTYVIGVQNPPVAGAPDTVSDLNRVAVAGGTNAAFLIETGNAEQTAADLTAIINEIRQTSVSCSMEIPPPPAGMDFDPMRVNVSYTTGAGAQIPLGYDDSCTAEHAWRYDDVANPSAILLCEVSCAAVQADAGARLSVEFGCSTREPE